MQKNDLIRKIRLILRFMTSQPGQQTVAIHVLTNISRRQGNQTMKFRYLIEYCMTNIFSLKNYTQNVVEELFPDPFLKNRNLAYLWINSLKFYIVCFYCMPSWGLSKYIETKLQTNCFYLIWSFFKKQKMPGTSFPGKFSVWFSRKNISLVVFY